MAKIKTSDCIGIVAVILITCVIAPNYIARELFAAMLLFSVLFILGAAMLSGAIFAWHMGKRLTDWGRFRSFASGVRRYTSDMVFRTPAA